MPPDAVVEDFDVIEDRGAGLGPGGEGSSVYELVLEGERIHLFESPFESVWIC